MEENLRRMLSEETDTMRIVEIQYRLFVFSSIASVKGCILAVEKIEQINRVIDGINMLCSIMAPLEYDKYLMVAARLDPYQIKSAPNGNNDNYKKLLDKRYTLITNGFKYVRSVEDFKKKTTAKLIQFANEWWVYRQDNVCRL